MQREKRLAWPAREMLPQALPRNPKSIHKPFPDNNLRIFRAGLITCSVPLFAGFPTVRHSRSGQSFQRKSARFSTISLSKFPRSMS